MYTQTFTKHLERSEHEHFVLKTQTDKNSLFSVSNSTLKFSNITESKYRFMNVIDRPNDDF
mgnify:CR=1 FL=1